LRTLTRVAAITLAAGEDHCHSAVIDPARQLAYFGTDTMPGKVVKVSVAPADFRRIGSLTFAGVDGMAHAASNDPARGELYFVTDMDPAQVVRVSTSTFTQTGVLTLEPGEKHLHPVVGDDHYLYFGAATSPGKVIRVNK